jgi:hypothetical protein
MYTANLVAMKSKVVATINDDKAPDILLNVTSTQNKLNASDAEMARRMHISRQLYQSNINRTKNIGYKFLRGLVQAFPGEFDLEVIVFMRNDK